MNAIPAAVKLQDLIDTVDGQPETFSSYLDRDSGIIYSVPEESFRIAEEDADCREEIPEWQLEEIGWARRIASSDRYLALPTSWDLHEWEIMQQFCNSIADESVCGEFLAVIHGRGAFRRFKDQLTHHGLWDIWHEFRRQALRQQLVSWCEEHGVPVQEGMADPDALGTDEAFWKDEKVVGKT